MSEFWVFALTIGAWIFLGMGCIAGAILMVTKGGLVGRIIGAALGCLILAILLAMYIWAVRGLP